MYIDGVRQPLDTHQTKLRDRYRDLPRRDLPEAYRRLTPQMGLFLLGDRLRRRRISCCRIRCARRWSGALASEAFQGLYSLIAIVTVRAR